MLRQSAESVPVAVRGRVLGISDGTRAPIRWWRSGAIQCATRRAIADFFESCARVVRKTHVPTRKGVLAFFGNQVLINAVAWTAGVIAAGFVKNFFEVKGFRNLWGLTASRSRTLVSADDYHLIMTLTSYAAGLIMLILVRHLILRLITEYHSLRLERAQCDGAPEQAPRWLQAPPRSLRGGPQ